MIDLEEVFQWASGLCSAHRQPSPVCRLCNPEIARLMAELETIRAEAMEEAAQVGAWHQTRDGLVGDPIRALAPLPSRLVAVSVETLKRVEEALTHTPCARFDETVRVMHKGCNCSDCTLYAEIAALLNGVKP